MNLTGIKDLDFVILNKVDDKSLGSYCSTNKIAKKWCDDEKFWMNRIITFYGQEALNGKGDLSYSEYYKSGRVKTYTMCQKIAKLPKRSQLVIEDFYNPDPGFVSRTFTRSQNFLLYLLTKIVLEKAKTFPEDTREMKLENTVREYFRDIWRRIHPATRYDLNPDVDYLTENELEHFYNIIGVPVGRPEILREIARTNPDLVRQLSPKPEIPFKLIAHIHKGFYSKKLPYTILWSELCFHPYVLDYKL